MKFHEISGKFIKFQIFQENHVLGCPGANRTAATIGKALELLMFLHAGAIRWSSCKFYEIHWKSGNSMKMEETLENHEISWNSLIFWIPRPFTKPLYSLLKIKVWAAWTPKNLKTRQKVLFSLNLPKFHHFRRIPGKCAKWCQNHFLEDSGGSLAATCWKPCYSYRNIEVFKLPGRTRNAPKHKKWWNFPKIWNFRTNHGISANFMKFHAISRK